MPRSPRSEDAPEDSFLRDPSDLDGFLEDLSSEPGEGGPAEAPGEVSVDVGRIRLDEETRGDAGEVLGDDLDSGGFWSSGFRPEEGDAEADEAAEEADAGGESDGGGLEEKLDELERERLSEGI